MYRQLAALPPAIFECKPAQFRLKALVYAHRVCVPGSVARWQSKLHIHKYDFIIVHRTEGILLKKIIKHDTTDGVITLHSLNALYDDFAINLNDVAQIFNVIKVEREK